MKIKLFSSVLVIMMALSAIGGATVAWFTAEAEIGDNVFTAGTLTIEAEESWGIGFEVDNWNPGDCTEKEVTVEVTGTKGIYLRAMIIESWTNTDGLDESNVNDRTIANINWKIDDGLGTLVDWSNDEWKMITINSETYWYYQGDLGTDGRLEPNEIIIFLSEVCLDGPGTGNEYQGATYTLGITFQAIQTTNHAEKFEWGVAYINITGVADGWFAVTNVGTLGGRWEDVAGEYYYDEINEEWLVIP